MISQSCVIRTEFAKEKHSSVGPPGARPNWQGRLLSAYPITKGDIRIRVSNYDTLWGYETNASSRLCHIYYVHLRPFLSRRFVDPLVSRLAVCVIWLPLAVSDGVLAGVETYSGLKKHGGVYQPARTVSEDHIFFNLD